MSKKTNEKKTSDDKKENKMISKVKPILKNKKFLYSALAFFVVLVGSIGAYFYFNRGFMISEKAEKLVAYASSYAPSDSYINGKNVNPSSYRISFTEEVANPELYSRDIKEGISIHPDIRGRWYFSGGRTIYFTPEKDWIPNTKYTVKLDNKIFSQQVIVKDKDFSFETPRFYTNLSSSQFYEDPRDTRKKQAIATFSFNYPIDETSLKDGVKVETISGEKYDFTVKVDDYYSNRIHIMSEPLRIKAEEDFIYIRVFGVKNIYNNEKIISEEKAKIKIPSSSTFFKITSFNTNIIYNEKNENRPEQILFLNFSTAVESKELAGYVDFYKLNNYCYNFRETLKKVADPSEIKDAKKLTVESMSEGSTKTHIFKYDIPEKRSCVVAKVKKGLGSKDGFILTNDENLNVDVADYPMSASIAFQGSILSLDGDKKLAVSSRAANKLEIQVARINSDDLNHLVSQTSGDFSTPYFRNYNFDETNISEIFDVTQSINMKHPADVNYSSVNLNEYFKSKKGIFLVKVRGYYNNDYSTPEDKRLIVITDMGIITKDNLDKTHDVFVSSFSEGKPVSGAKVEVLGKNGITILEGQTNGQGMVKFPDYSDFKKDKEPVAYVVTDGKDLSYMPIGKYDRRMDYSRFDVEGVYDSGEENKITGYTFSDRGIYRPGEEARFGIMVRDTNLNAPDKYPMSITVINSNGDEVANKKVWSNEFGMIDFKYNVPRTAPVGHYSINLYDESKTYKTYIAGTTFKVEEFVPDTMKIKLMLENVKSKGWYKLPELKAEVDLQNLYGNPASGHNVKARVLMSPTTFWFKEYSSYNFRDPLRDINNNYVRSYNEELDTLQTNEQGKANYNVDISQFDKGTYSLTLDVEGFELDSGRSVFTSSSALVSPLDYIVGYKADGSLYGISKNAERSVDFIAIDNELKKISKDDLKIEEFRVDYVTSLMEMPNGTYQYQTVSKDVQIKRETDAFPITENGRKLTLDTKNPGKRYILIKDNDGKLLSRVDYSVEGGENTDYLLDKEANLSVTLDKKEYNHGDEIKVKVVAPYEGYGLITIERDKTYNYKWFKISSKTTTESIRLPYTVEGNAYINVAFVRDIKSKEIFIPPLSYAVVPFGINKHARTVDIDLDIAEITKPGEDLVVRYKASKPGKIIIYGVNQGILQVANYTTPNPISQFMKKKALRVSSSQIMDLIMPEMNVVLNHKAPGGDDYDEEELKSQINPFARKQNEPVAFWSGVIDATEDYQEYRYKVPAIFNGQIKVMAVAVSEKGFGVKDKSTFVRGDFALTPNAPFNVIPGDVFDVGTSVANMVEDSGDNYEVKVTLDATEGLEVLGDKEFILKLREKGEGSVRFKIRATDKLGSSTITFKAEAVKDASKNFSMPHHIGIRPATPYVTSLTMGYEPSSVKLKDFVTPMFKEYRKQEVTASTSPLVLSEGLVKFLDKYPHECSEQLISRAYPTMVMLFTEPKIVEGFDVYAMYDKALAKLNERQKLDGGFSVWSGSYGDSNEYISLYAFDFLTAAKKYNFNVPNGMLNKATNYVKSVAGRDMNSIEDTNVPYAIYLLTKSGETTTNYLLNAEAYLEENHKKTWKNSLAGTYIAASYSLLKSDVKARGALGKYKFGERTVDDSKYIYLMATHFKDDFKDLKQDVVKELIKPLKDNRYTTNSSAHSLLALSAYDLSGDKDILFKGKEADYTNFAKVGVTAEDKILEITSPNSFFYVVSQQGFVSAPVLKPYSNFVEVHKEYLDNHGNRVNSAKIGDDIAVKITIRTTGKKDYVNDVAITDLIPGCFEMVIDSISSSGYLDYKEEREDRALIYLTANKSTRVITYKVKAIARGEFVAPATFVEALYDTDVRGNTASSTFKVEE